jgi:hypothetical protein
LADLDLSGIPGLEGVDFGKKSDDSPAPDDAISPDAGGADPTPEPISDPAPDDATAGNEPLGDPSAPQSAIEWQQLIERIPEPLHEEIRPMLQEYERQYQRVNEQLAPFKQFVDSGVSQADVELALSIHNAMLMDPKRFYDSFGESYGWNVPAPQQQQTPVQYQQPQRMSYEEFFEEDGVTPQAGVDPQLIQILQAQQERLDMLVQAQEYNQQREQQYVAQQQQEQQREQGRQQMEAEFQEIQAKYGDFDKQEVVKRAFANASAGKNPTLTNAYHELRDYEQKILQRQAAQRPPVVLGGANGTPPQAPVPLNTEDERRAAALELAIRLGANAPGQFQ